MNVGWLGWEALLLVPVLAYGALLAWYVTGWQRLMQAAPKETADTAPYPSVSVVIPARNEASRITFLLDDLARQHYPADRWHVMVVDDASTDETGAVVQRWFDQHPQVNSTYLRQEEDPTESAPKKRALRAGFAQSTQEVLVTLDADGRLGPQWLDALIKTMVAEQAQMVLGPVLMAEPSRWWHRLLVLENFALQGLTGASAAWRSPILANGANLAFTRASWEARHRAQDGLKLASGDDVFFMLALKRDGQQTIRYASSQAAVVRTPHPESLTAFWQQRVRWASKAPAYRDPHLLWNGALTLLANSCLLVALVLGLSGLVSGWLFALVFSVKSIADYFFLRPVTSYFNSSKYLRLLPLLQLLYPCYGLAIALRAQLGGYRWKGRKHP